MAANIRGAHPTIAASAAPATIEVRLLRAAVEDEPTRALPLAAVRAPTHVAEVRAEERPERARQARQQNDAEPGSRIVPQPSALVPRVTDSTYYTAQQIDVYPSLLAPLTLGALAGSGALAAEALVRLRVDELGRLTHFAVLQGDPEGASGEVLRSTFSAAKFSAARKNGYPVKSEIVVRVLPGPHAEATAAEVDTAAVERTY